MLPLKRDGRDLSPRKEPSKRSSTIDWAKLSGEEIKQRAQETLRQIRDSTISKPAAPKLTGQQIKEPAMEGLRQMRERNGTVAEPAAPPKLTAQEINERVLVGFRQMRERNGTVSKPAAPKLTAQEIKARVLEGMRQAQERKCNADSQPSDPSKPRDQSLDIGKASNPETVAEG
ncbi:hypothetical protein QM012_001008 [Aureobasidium pullulans]|uniref:Uncharacterized protein n=1 Tax=Aureobasidium pullulans TaxID=5580 RepID=A0ABR0TFF9_AURPU